MWTTIKNNYKTILATLGLLFVSIIVAFLFEDYYQQLVRFSYKFFNAYNIQFSGKNFHLFASDSFVAAFGLFTSLTFLLIKFTSRHYRIRRACAISLREIAIKNHMSFSAIRTQFQLIDIYLANEPYTQIPMEMYNVWLKKYDWAIEIANAEYNAVFETETPESYGYRNWSEMELNEVWEGNIDEYNAHNSDEYNALNADELNNKLFNRVSKTISYL